jgi:hypothetical protein
VRVSIEPGCAWQSGMQEVRVLATDRGEPGVGILEVGPGITFEGQHAIPVEEVVVDS